MVGVRRAPSDPRSGRRRGVDRGDRPRVVRVEAPVVRRHGGSSSHLGGGGGRHRQRPVVSARTTVELVQVLNFGRQVWSIIVPKKILDLPGGPIKDHFVELTRRPSRALNLFAYVAFRGTEIKGHSPMAREIFHNDQVFHSKI